MSVLSNKNQEIVDLMTKCEVLQGAYNTACLRFEKAEARIAELEAEVSTLKSQLARVKGITVEEILSILDSHKCVVSEGYKTIGIGEWSFADVVEEAHRLITEKLEGV